MKAELCPFVRELLIDRTGPVEDYQGLLGFPGIVQEPCEVVLSAQLQARLLHNVDKRKSLPDAGDPSLRVDLSNTVGHLEEGTALQVGVVQMPIDLQGFLQRGFGGLELPHVLHVAALQAHDVGAVERIIRALLLENAPGFIKGAARALEVGSEPASVSE